MRTFTTTDLLDPELARSSRVLAARADDLRHQAEDDTAVAAVLAPAYRRRAAELELASWALAARAGARDELLDPTGAQLHAAA